MELMVVILLIGILVATALPHYRVIVLRSKLATVKDNAHTLARAVQHYYLIHDKGPEKIEDLDIEPAGCWFNYSDDSTREIGCDAGTGTNRITYIAQAYYRSPTIFRYCYTYDKANLSSASNRVCQLETNRKSPSYCSSYCKYPYQ